MATRKIKDAKDLDTGELVYFKGHAKATYMSDGRSVEEAILDNTNGAYLEVNHGTSDTTFTLTPNTFHIWGEVSSLTLTLGAKNSGIVNEYLFQFTSGATATSLSLPSVVEWVGGIPAIEPNKVYRCSIINNIGSIIGV